MASKPLVSVVIVSYNYAKFIRKAINSVLSQTLPLSKIEIIVVDDGSTDETRQVMREFEGKLKYCRIKHCNATAASNYGISLAHAEYVIKLDADDWLDENALLAMSDALERNKKLGFVYCDVRVIKGRVEKILSLKKFDLFKMLACNIMFRRKALMSVAIEGKVYREDLPSFDEYELLCRIMGKFGGAHVAKPLYNYFRHKKTMASDRCSACGSKKPLTQVFPLCKRCLKNQRSDFCQKFLIK
jgi:glycosyltransferase involved in cell wall biosynthesis